jgi:flagellar hook-length control protein FliK
MPISGIAIQIATMAQAGKNRFEIRLDPPELGRIEVRLDVDRDGHVTSRLIADRSDTLNLLRNDATGLERALQDAGLKTAGNGLQFSLRDQTMNGGQQNAAANASNTTQIVVQDSTVPAGDLPQSIYSRLAGLRGGVDIRV